MNKISVLVPVLIRNESQIDMTLKCISKARSLTDITFELVIVETGSSHFIDHADVYVMEKYKTNATKSINRGFRCCSGEYVVLLTNDVFLDEGWLEALLECFYMKEDCGLSTLATTQLGHFKENKIEEGIWFSVAMMKKGDLFDEDYVNSWDDTDLIMRKYLEGKKMYRNFNVVVDHLVGATHYEDDNHKRNFNMNKKRFMDKYIEHKDNRIYKILTEGTII